MKTLSAIVLASFIFAGTAHAQQKDNMKTPDFTGSLRYYVPGQDDDYDSGFGAEAQIRYWQNENLGFALAGGIASWEVNDQEAIVSDGAVGVGASLEGDVLLLPIGGSILYRPSSTGKLNLVLEGGLRYVIVESNAEASFAAADAFGGFVGGTADIEIDNGVIGLIAAHLESELSSGVSLLGGIGYQFDLVKGDATWMGEDLGENELKAFYIQAGFKIKF